MFQCVRRTVAALVVAAALPFVLPTTAHAQTTYATFADFLAGVGSYGVDTFDDLDYLPIDGPLLRQAGSFGYTAAAAAAPLNQFFPVESFAVSGDWYLSEETGGSGLNFSGFGANVFAIGGSFFATDFEGAFSPTSLRIRAVDVNNVVYDNIFMPGSADGFFGIRFNNALASLQISAIDDGQGSYEFATANNLVLAEAARVPEPSSVWLLVVGASTLLVVGVRRRVR